MNQVTKRKAKKSGGQSSLFPDLIFITARQSSLNLIQSTPSTLINHWTAYQSSPSPLRLTFLLDLLNSKNALYHSPNLCFKSCCPSYPRSKATARMYGPQADQPLRFGRCYEKNRSIKDCKRFWTLYLLCQGTSELRFRSTETVPRERADERVVHFADSHRYRRRFRSRSRSTTSSYRREARFRHLGRPQIR